MKLNKIQIDNFEWRVVVFDHSENFVGEFFASRNLNEDTNRDFPFNITFESPRYDEVMSEVLHRQDEIQDWFMDTTASKEFN